MARSWNIGTSEWTAIPLPDLMRVTDYGGRRYAFWHVMLNVFVNAHAEG